MNVFINGNIKYAIFIIYNKMKILYLYQFYKVG
jgi:hypothetical protein